MQVVELLKERFFWVDSLCIIQDDTDKEHDIKNMAGIYANGVLTIIAEGNSDADDGRRGLGGSSLPRTWPQSARSIGKWDVFYDPLDSMPHWNDKAAWNRRGWTFQEEHFSTRRIYFRNGEIRWVCGKGKAYERQPRRLLNALQDFLSFDTMLGSMPLAGLVEEFSYRKLTYPEDRASAFSGIAAALGAVFEGGFISSLPAAFFDTALLWRPRRITSRVEPGRGSKYQPPSWSWVGWSGEVQCDWWETVEEALETHEGLVRESGRDKFLALVMWHRLDRELGEFVPINATFNDFNPLYQNQSIQLPEGWISKAVPELDKRGLLTPKLTEYFFYKSCSTAFRYPFRIPRPDTKPLVIQSELISCKTHRAFLFPRGGWGIEPLPFPELFPSVDLLDQAGRWAGILFPNVTSQSLLGHSRPHGILLPRMELVEMARVSRDVGDEPDEYPGKGDTKEEQMMEGITITTSCGLNGSKAWPTARG